MAALNDATTVGSSIAELENLAAEVLALKKETRPRRPILIEFCGSPKAGKTSCMNALQIFLRRNEFRTRTLTERASISPIGDKFDPRFNIWTASSTIAEMVESTWLGILETDVIVADRALFDALCWFTWLNTHGKLDGDNYSRLTGYLTAPILRSAIDLIYVFRAAPSTSMDREYATLLTRKKGSIMNEDVLASYLQAIDLTVERFGGDFRAVREIDTSTITQNDVSHAVTTQTLHALRDLTVEKVAWFPLELLQKRVGSSGPLLPSDIVEGAAIEFDYRPQVENDRSRVQPLPVVVVLTSDRKRILLLRKRQESTSPSSPERDKTLAYAGGHIREEDVIAAGSTNLLSVCKAALQRETKEELGLSIALPDSPLFCVWDKANPRSEQHLAIVFLYEIEEAEANIRLDTNEFVQQKGTSRSGRLVPLEQAFQDLEGNKSEEWTRVIIRELNSRALLGQTFLQERLPTELLE